MSALLWIGQHRWWIVGVGLVVAVAVAAAAVWFFVFRTPATRLDLRQALRLYRQDQGSGAAGDVRLPTSGVYRYRTSGGEHLSIGGIGRSFPSMSQMIVTDTGACTSFKWEPLVQHVEGLVVCPASDGALRISAASSFEQIAGDTTTTVINCPSGTYLVPPDPHAGSRWRAVCHSTAHQRVVFSGEVVGSSSVTVGGRRVPAVHTRVTLHFTGKTKGTNPNNYWVTPRDGLILRQQETVDVSEQAGPLGAVRYGEQMAIVLQSRSPVR